MGYIRIKHTIVEEHFAPQMTSPTVEPKVEATMEPMVEVAPAPESCSTVTMSASLPEPVAKAEEPTPMPKAMVDNIQASSAKLWTNFNNANQRLISASLNNPAQVELLKARAMLTVKDIAQYVYKYFGEAAASAVNSAVTDLEIALTEVIRNATSGMDTEPAKAEATKYIYVLGNLLQSVDATHWPEGPVCDAFKIYATLTADQASAEYQKDWALADTTSAEIEKIIDAIAGVFASGFVGVTPQNF